MRPPWPLIPLALVLLLAGFSQARADEPGAGPSPNVVIIYADDLGYGDLGCYGAPGDPTPHLDRLAAQGMRFTDFYVAQAVCSASRTALLTGCYPNRLGIAGALGPNAPIGINPDETLISEVLKPAGYATAIYGKWHLGDAPEFLPPAHGFDEYFGLPYSNDMWPRHPGNPRAFPPLKLIDGKAVIARDPDQHNLTRWYRDRAVKFIETHEGEPFFLYLAHSMPHVPIYASGPFEGKTGRGLYADVIAEIDESVGAVMETLARLGLEENTIVMFASDNGPWLSYGDHAGTTGGLREGKGTSFEGGVRVPFIARWPGRIPAGAPCREPAMTIDVLPTVAGITGQPLSSERAIDGLDIGPLLRGEPGARSPHEALIFTGMGGWRRCAASAGSCISRINIGI